MKKLLTALVAVLALTLGPSLASAAEIAPPGQRDGQRQHQRMQHGKGKHHRMHGKRGQKGKHGKRHHHRGEGKAGKGQQGGKQEGKRGGGRGRD